MNNAQLREFLSLKTLQNMVPKLQKTIYDKLLSFIAKSMKAEESTHFDEIKDVMLARLLAEISSEEDVGEQLIAFNLEACLNLLKADGFDRRLKGLKDMKRIIQRTKKQERSVGQTLNKLFTEEKKEPKPIDPKFILGWLQENNVIPLCFNIIQSHVELVRQSTELLIFLAQNNELNTAHLDILWKGSLV